MKLTLCFLYIAAVGILSHWVGEALPREWFNPEKPPFAPFSWEKEGRFYEKLHVRRWKDRVPDMSKHSKGMVRKGIALGGSSESASRVAVETCVAEAVHWALILFAPIIYRIKSTPLGAFIALVYALSNLPFIIIQRYNRPKLCLLARRLEEREARIRDSLSR